DEGCCRISIEPLTTSVHGCAGKQASPQRARYRLSDSFDNGRAAQDQEQRLLRVDAHLSEDGTEMIPNGARTDMQRREDRANSHPIAQKPYDFPLPQCEIGSRKYRFGRPGLVVRGCGEAGRADLLGDPPESPLELGRSSCFGCCIEQRRVPEDEAEAVATLPLRKQKRGHANPSSLCVARIEPKGATDARAPHSLRRCDEVGDVIRVDVLQQRRADDDFLLVTENTSHSRTDLGHAPVVVVPAENELIL